ncbi:MAG: winged helix-turn-helix domain-containing protein [Acidobacteriia bacterium]|nr:winged helix-turn-helix domain-containing protein [Terriglobia bacterium]
MASIVPVEHLAFGPFCLDLTNTRLLRDGVPVELRLQAFYALQVLLQNAGRPVDYEQMIREAWDGVLVSRHTVAVTVGEVKKALREYGAWISCRPGLGYRLDAPQSEALIRKGWHFLSHRTREGLDRAVGCFEQAAREDQADFRAFEGLSRAYLTMGTSGMRAPREIYPAFLGAHRRAVALAGLTPELRSDCGYALHMFERKLAAAETELLQTRREQPSLANNYVRLTMLYTAFGRLDEALEALDEAYAADALLPILPATEISVRFCRREFDRAVECGKKAVELHPYVQWARVFYAQALEHSGRCEEALVQYRHACVICPNLPWLRALEAACLARSGRRREAQEVLGELERVRATEYVDAYYMALLRDALGNRDEAFDELDRAFEEGSAALSILDVDPKMDSLRGDPRFPRLSQRCSS